MNLSQLEELYEAGWMPILSIANDRRVGISSGVSGFSAARVTLWTIDTSFTTIYTRPLINQPLIGFDFPR